MCNWSVCALQTALGTMLPNIHAMHFLENVKIILTQVSLQIKRNLTKICGEPKQSGQDFAVICTDDISTEKKMLF